MFLKEILKDKKYRVIFWTGLLIHLWTAYFSKGYHRPDEHLGMIRYVALKLEMFDYHELLKVNWEFKDQIRSWIQPGIYYSLLYPFKAIGLNNPFHLVFILKLFTSLSYFFSTVYLWDKFKDIIKNEQIRFYSFCSISFLWFMPFVHVRTTTESFAAILMAITVGALSTSNWKKSLQNIFLIGFLLSLIFQVRVPAISFVLGILIFLFVVQKESWRVFWPMFIGGLAACALTIAVDSWGYGNFNYSTLTFLILEFTKDVSNGFGVSPFYEFISETFTRGIPPISIFIILSFLFYWIKNPKSILTWSTLPFFILHSMIGHKELRFIFPLTIFIPLFIGHFWDQLQSHKISKMTWPKILIKFCFVLNTLALVYASTAPALSEIGFYEKMYHSSISPDTIFTYGEIRDQLKFYQNKTFHFSEIKEQDRDTFLEKAPKPIWVMTLTLQDIEKYQLEKRCQKILSSSSDFIYQNQFLRSKIKKLKAWTLFNCLK